VEQQKALTQKLLPVKRSTPSTGCVDRTFAGTNPLQDGYEHQRP
jgi:hypothetical protein